MYIYTRKRKEKKKHNHFYDTGCFNRLIYQKSEFRNNLKSRPRNDYASAGLRDDDDEEEVEEEEAEAVADDYLAVKLIPIRFCYLVITNWVRIFDKCDNIG